MGDIEEAIKLKVASDEAVPNSLLEVADDVEQVLEDYKEKSDSQVSEDVDDSSLDEKISKFAADNALDEKTNNLLAIGALSELLDEMGNVEENTTFNELNPSQKILKLKIDKLLSGVNASLSQKSDDSSGSIFSKNILNIKLIDKKFFNSELYAPAEIVADMLDMQYIWNGSLVKGWIVGKGKKYYFSQGKKLVIISKKYKEMSNLAVFESNKNSLEGKLWLPKSFLLDEFKLTLQSVKTTNKSIIYDESTYEKMKDMLKNIK